MLPIILPTTVLIIAVAISLPQLYNSSRQEIAFDFPAEDLRTELPVPDFALVNHRYELVTAEDFKGEVSIITAVYASCNETCPLILEQIKRVFGKLDKKIQDQVNVLIISMNPEKDTAGILSVTAEHYEFFHPNFQLLTGEPSRVDHLLDLFSIPRYKKYDGTIDHANMFIVIDKKGKIAYRFALGPNQEEWLLEAIQLLVNETNIALQ